MPEFKLFSRCEGCHGLKFYIARRAVRIPFTKDIIKSRLLFCGRCIAGIKSQLNKDENKN